ncbi:MAG: hypothetical protein JJW01_00325 [Alphaproteobacteria bacterium]|nr:hypothetical protein [Rickettsiales bacterium]
MRFFFPLVCLFLLKPCYNILANTRVTPSSYIVSDIEILSIESDRSIAERELFSMAKQKALSFVKLYLNKSHLETDDVDIDSLMIEFTPINIFAVKNGYVGYFEIVFDRDAIESLLITSQIDKNEKREWLSFRVSIMSGVKQWLIIREMLLKNNVNIKISLLAPFYIDFKVFDKNIQEIETIFAEQGFEIVKNNFLYFIKPVDEREI